MEKIFNMTVSRFRNEMKKISEEAFEAYGDCLLPDKIPSDESLCFDLLGIVFAYVKIEYEEKADTVLLLKCLQNIIQTGEVIYMQVSGTEDMIRNSKAALTDSRQHAVNMAVLAGMILEYYFRVYERRNFGQAYHRKIRKALQNLLAESSQDIVKRKVHSDQEKKPLPICIKEHLEDTMVGQEEAKKTVALAVHDFISLGERSVVLLEGPTGSGKSFLFKNLSEFEPLKEELTFFSYTATQLTPNGFSGDNVEDFLKDYRKACEYRCASNLVSFTDKGVIFIDEFDKLLNPNFDSGGEDVNALVIAQLLTYIDGTAVTAGVNMKNVLFILAGAFENMEINREIERNRHPVGFMNGAEDEGEDTAGAESPGSYDLEAELRRKNISRELLGRITHIVHMDAIDRDAMREILIDPDNGVLTGWKKRFEASGLSLIIENDQVIEGILDNVMNKNVGARGIRKIVESMIGMYRYDMLEKGYQVMVLHPGMFEGEPPKFYQERTCESILRPEHFRARNPEKNIR